MIMKFLPIVLITVVLITGCNAIASKSSESSIVKQTENKQSVPTADSRFTTSDSQNEMEIELVYPTQIIYPTMKQVDFIISSFPRSASICRLTTVLGELSIKKLILANDHMFIYYFPNTTEPMQVDSIILYFYDEYGDFILKKRIVLEYFEDTKEYLVIEKLPSLP